MLNGPSLRKIIGLQLVTFGFYYYYWSVICRRELNKAIGSNYVPSAWLLAVPGINYWWVWQYAHALESVTLRRVKYSETFLLYVIASAVPSSIIGGVLQFIFAFMSDEEPSNSQLIFILSCFTVGIFLMVLMTNTLFMSVMQKKVDKIRQV